MEEIEKKVFEIIGRTSKSELSERLKVTRPLLERRLKNGGWKKTEIELINKILLELTVTT